MDTATTLHGVDLVKAILQLGAAGLLLIGLLVVARVFTQMWIQMREAEQRALTESRNWSTASLTSAQKIAETMQAAVTEARSLTSELRELARDLRESRNTH